MPTDGIHRSSLLSALLIATLVSLPAYAAMDPRFELDPQALGAASPAVKKTGPGRPAPRPRPDTPRVTTAEGATIYVVKPGDNLFKILIRDFGLRNDEADALVEVIRRENTIPDIRNLKVGQRIAIPAVPHRAKRPVPRLQAESEGAGKAKAGPTFMLESPDAVLTELEAIVQIRQVWDRMIPPPTAGLQPVVIQSPAYSLSLDPQRYPIYAAMGNGRILVDRTASIPPLVKELITAGDPSVRIVTESPRNPKSFISAMLDSAGFYSVEENFSLEFGTDPRLTVRSDFKIEKSPESLINQDMILMNSGRTPYPKTVSEFLNKEGLTVYEPFADYKPVASAANGRVFQISSRNQPEIIDGLLSTFSIVPEKEKRVDVFSGENNGISLSIKADRYFELDGKRHVVSRFDGDPVTYTLYRLLEARGYQVVILEPRDDFRKVTEKLLSRLQIQGLFDRHQFAPDVGANYSLSMSGFKLEGAGLPVAGMFLTNLELDPVIRNLLVENGYSIAVR